VRVLAARFRDRQTASAALDALRRRLALADEDAAIAPLGTPGARDEGEATLLAGHFHETQVALVHSTVTHAGGDVVADVDERWTRPRIVADASQPPIKQHNTRAGNARHMQPIA
jgi:hypothetical protein